MSQMGH